MPKRTEAAAHRRTSPASGDAETSPPDLSFPVVGIGASAGGLAALEAFFSAMPVAEDPGMAFVLVQHLVPDHDSLLAALIQRRTRMPVSEVEDGVLVQINCVYVIPPNREMVFEEGRLRLQEPAAARGQRLPIDILFRSLAKDRLQLAIGVVLSGTGTDGTLGAQAIKAEGGLVIAQSPSSAQFDGMPSSVIASGVVDFQVGPAEMPTLLIAYARRALDRPSDGPDAPPASSERALSKIFSQLRTQTGHDFSQYKPSTTLRRIDRRMVVHQIDTVDGYVKYLKETPSEAQALFHDLLIGVTSFFRDAEAFRTLETEVIPKLFEGKPAGSAIRVWSAGCSTGEEAYSLAILLQERLEALRSNYKVQVFATDLDSRAIATARAGLYPVGIAADVTPERLARFFTAVPDGSGYRIHKSIRDLLVLSEQNLIQDPPFSKLDLISCRNVLIYLGTELQQRLIPLFHYALNPGGVLFLGTSETVGDFADLFVAHDRKCKLYQRKANVHSTHYVGFGRTPSPNNAHTPHPAADLERFAPKSLSPRALTEATLLQHATLFAALVNGIGDILYLHGRSGMYLEPAAGVAGTNNILRMAREGLRAELALALKKARTSQEPVRTNSVKVKTNGHYTAVNLTVCRPAISPVPSREAALYLVILQDAPAQTMSHPTRAPVPPKGHAQQGPEAELRVADLSDELHAKEEYLQAANEELATANEEMQSTNEEMQSVNEELQSSNEELETSKEEMQSMNEELITVNSELQAKVTDLSRASSDMNNLLASTGVGTVFVNHQLRILRFTPSATRIINLIPSDVGRPVAHIASNLISYDRLVEDTQAVLDTLTSRDVDVQAREGGWYKMRILPYRTLDNVIEGAVITFIDITETVLARDALRKANEILRLAVVVRDAHDAITMQDMDGRILAWNPGAVRMYGWSESEALQLQVGERVPKALLQGELAKVHQLSQMEILEPYRTQRCTKSGAVVEVWMTATALVNEAGTTYAIATTERAKTHNAPSSTDADLAR